VQNFRALRLEALRSHPDVFSSDFAVNAQQPLEFWLGRLRTPVNAGQLFFAEHNTALIGMTGIRRGDSPKTRHSAMIWGVYVQPEWRGQHVAEGLLNEGLAWARQQAVKIVKLAVVSTNAAAIRCYARCGFTVYGLEPQALEFDGVLYDELLMSRLV
jgi:RimJ/RimL family protein N-acetyltransferase